MGRNAKFDREEAIEVCMQEIWSKGYEACSVKAISDKLGITRSSFYNAFGSRESLFLEVLERYLSRPQAKLLGDISEHDSVLRHITAFFHEVCRNGASDPEFRGCLATNCVAGLVGFDETLGPVIMKHYLSILKQFENALALAAERGEIEADTDLHCKALSLQNLLAGLTLMSKVVRSEKELTSVVNDTLTGLGLYKPS